VSTAQALVVAFVLGVGIAVVAMSLVRRLRRFGSLALMAGGPAGQPTFISPTSSPGPAALGSAAPLIDAMMKDLPGPGAYRRCAGCGAMEANPAATACSTCKAPLPGFPGISNLPPGVQVIQSAVRVQWSGAKLPPELADLVAQGMQPCPGCGGHDWQGQLAQDGRAQLICSHCGQQHP